MPRLLCIEERTGNEISHEHSIKFSAHGASFMAGFPPVTSCDSGSEGLAQNNAIPLFQFLDL